MRRYVHPEGARFPALERNILKYRAIEMVLVLFYAEELRNFFVNFIKARDLHRGILEESDNSNSRNTTGDKKLLQRAISYFSNKHLLNEGEKKEIKELMDYRNHIAHRIEYLFGDIGRTSFVRDHIELIREKGLEYNYNALRRLRFYRETLPEKVNDHIQMISLSPLLFEGADKTFAGELKRLDRKICQQIKERKRKIDGLHAQCSLDGTGLKDNFDLRHPKNQYKSGRLTKRGTEVCYRLYDAGKSPLVVAYLMDLSLHAANKRQKLWKTAGGQRRQRIGIDTP